MPDGTTSFPICADMGWRERLAALLTDPLVALVLEADGLTPDTVFTELAAVASTARCLDGRPAHDPAGGPAHDLADGQAIVPGAYRRRLAELAEAVRERSVADSLLLARLDHEGVRLLPDTTAAAIQVGIDALDRWAFGGTAEETAPTVAEACRRLAQDLLPLIGAAEPAFLAQVRRISQSAGPAAGHRPANEPREIATRTTLREDLT